MKKRLTIKDRFKQVICKHQEVQWYIDTSYLSIKGERRVAFCKKCGKKTADFIAEYEGSGFK